jgi:hypothetical protein
MGKVFDRPYAPSTLGSFLRTFAFGHVRQLDAVAARFLARLAARAPILPAGDGLVLVDVDDTIVQVHGHAKQGAGFGYSRVRGLNALLATVATDTAAPLIVAQRLRKGSTSSPRGAARLVADALATLRGASATGTGPVLLRADSAFFGSPTVTTAIRGGAAVSVTVSLLPRSVPRSPPSARTRGPRLRTGKRSSTPTAADGSPALRRRRCRSPRSCPGPSRTRSRVGLWSAGSQI